VRVDSFADKSRVSRKYKIAFQLSPDEMKFISIGPDVGSCAFNSVLLIVSVMRDATLAKGIADVALISERTERSLLRKDNWV